MQDVKPLYDAARTQFNKKHHIAHGYDHAVRVARLASYIAINERYEDPQEAELAGLLHDIGRTLQDEAENHGPAGVPRAGEMLNTYTTLDDAAKTRMLHAIRDHSAFKAHGELTHILQDADKLDGLGAVGLMRAYTSAAQLPAYFDNGIIPTKGARGTSIHEQIAFQLEWAGMMETDTGRQLACSRQRTMIEFLRTFESEVSEPA